MNTFGGNSMVPAAVPAHYRHANPFFNRIKFVGGAPSRLTSHYWLGYQHPLDDVAKID